MLRTAELLTAAFANITIAPDTTGVVALPLTKMGQVRGAQEVVTIDDPMVGLLIRKVFSLRQQARGAVLVGTSAEFRSTFVACLERLGVGMFNFRPYSIRRGGATHDFTSHGDIARTVWRGRWSDSRTAPHLHHRRPGKANFTGVLRGGERDHASLCRRLSDVAVYVTLLDFPFYTQALSATMHVFFVWG